MIDRELSSAACRIELESDSNILDLALAVHGSATGSCDPVSREDFERLVIAEETWKPSTINKFEPFDNAVRELIKIAIQEYRECCLKAT